MLQEILTHLGGNHPWAGSIQYFETITSTNDVLKQMALDGAPEGTVLIADQQTGGRGRLGRSFLSPPHTGIYMSVLLRPNCAPAELMHLTCAAAAAMCEAVEAAAGYRPGIKWTNDIVYQKRKLAGILTELGFTKDGRVSYAVIGIGVNCTQKETDFAPEIQNIAGSVQMFAKGTVSRPLLAAQMVDHLYRIAKNLLTGKKVIMEAYRRDCITLGKPVSIVRTDLTTYGTALDIDEDGGLIVRFADGHTDTVASGEVSVRGMYGYL